MTSPASSSSAIRWNDRSRFGLTIRMCWAMVPNSSDTTAIEAKSISTAKMRPPVEIGFGREEEIVVICELVQNRASPYDVTSEPGAPRSSR